MIVSAAPGTATVSAFPSTLIFSTMSVAAFGRGSGCQAGCGSVFGSDGLGAGSGNAGERGRRAKRMTTRRTRRRKSGGGVAGVLGTCYRSMTAEHEGTAAEDGVPSLRTPVKNEEEV